MTRASVLLALAAVAIVCSFVLVGAHAAAPDDTSTVHVYKAPS